MTQTIIVSKELRQLLETLSDKGFTYIMRDPCNGDAYAYQHLPQYVPEEGYYDAEGDMFYLSANTCTMLILDHDLDIPEDVDYFADITPEEPISIADLLAQ